MIQRIVAIFILVPLCLFADFSKKDAKNFTKKLWRSFKTKDTEWLETHTSSAFQFVQFGSQSNKDQTIDFVRRLNILCYKLSSFTVTKRGDLFIVSYVTKSNQQFEGQTFSRNGNRVTVCKEIDGHLKWVGQADVSPTEPVPPGPCL